jgi:hypothetical protein
MKPQMMFSKQQRLFFWAALVLFFLVSPYTFSDSPMFSVDRFINPETCGDCHSTIYSQWKNSMHGLAHDDPVYVAVSAYLLKGLTDAEEIAEGESCVKCHTPVGYVSGYPTKTSDDRSKVAPVATKGIQCDYCHSATGATKMENNALVLDPGHGENDPGIKRGPYKDSQSDFHDSDFSEFHTQSEVCGTCHNVSHVSFGTKLETTYDEWKNGPYNSPDEKKRITCQGCHMVQRPKIPATASTPRPNNRTTASDDGPVRDHVFTHYFVGANTAIPTSFGDKQKGKMALERLQNSATLALNTTRIAKGKLGITIINSGAGHYLPTGLTDIRQMWLDIRIVDGNNKVVFSSGQLGKNGVVPKGSIIYNTVFGDGNGVPVANINKAREVLKDKRIPPLESINEEIVFKKGKAKKLTIRVRLQYRSAPQELLDTVLGKGKIVLPVITMEQIEKTVEL